MDVSLETFISSLYRRVQLAAAIFVIKSTPEGMAPETHAFHLQQKLKLQWLNSAFSESAGLPRVSVDYHVLNQQQKALSSRLLSVISQTPNESLDDYPFELVNDNNCDATVTKACDPSKVQGRLENRVMDSRTLQVNANFIHAIIQLRALAEFESTIPMEKYIGSVAKLVGRKNTIIVPGAEAPESQIASEDSGFHTEDIDGSSLQKTGAKPSSITGVASSMLLYIISSHSADQLLQKSTQAILYKFKEVVYQFDSQCTVLNLDHLVNQWMGSVYEQALEVVRTVIRVYDEQPGESNQSSYHQMCSTLIQEIILEIAEGPFAVQDGYFIKENLVVIVLQMCEGTTLGSSALHFIFNKILDFAKVNERSERPTVPSAPDYWQEESEKMEKRYFLFLLARAFLASVSHFETSLENSKRKVNVPSQCDMPPKTNTIGDLWRKHYDVQVSYCFESHREDRIGKLNSDVRCWRQVLEDAFIKFLPKYPLITVLVTECLDLLDVLDH